MLFNLSSNLLKKHQRKLQWSHTIKRLNTCCPKLGEMTTACLGKFKNHSLIQMYQITANIAHFQSILPPFNLPKPSYLDKRWSSKDLGQTHFSSKIENNLFHISKPLDNEQVIYVLVILETQGSNIWGIIIRSSIL